jgi:hypothetical protein
MGVALWRVSRHGSINVEDFFRARLVKKGPLVKSDIWPFLTKLAIATVSPI